MADRRCSTLLLGRGASGKSTLQRAAQAAARAAPHAKIRLSQAPTVRPHVFPPPPALSDSPPQTGVEVDHLVWLGRALTLREVGWPIATMWSSYFREALSVVVRPFVRACERG
jgi:hypothetical protein